MASQYAFRLASPPPPPPPGSRRGMSPAAAAAASSTAAAATTASMMLSRNTSPAAPLSRSYNPALYTGSPAPVGPHCLRRPSMSPMRSTRGEDGGAGRQYNPQQYGQLAGHGGAFVPAPQQEELPPPPYSPPHTGRSSQQSRQSHQQPLSQRSAQQQQLHVSPPHQRPATWAHGHGATSTPTSPENPLAPSQQPTPSTATTQQSFSPFPHGTSATTTPLSAGDSNPPAWAAQARRRGYSPPPAPTYAPSALQQTSFPNSSSESATPPAATRNPSNPPSASRSVSTTGIPPPPPGPPPAASRSASVNSALPGSRDPSLTRAPIPPPPPGGPPPRSESLTRIQQLMQRQRSISTPANIRPNVASAMASSIAANSSNSNNSTSSRQNTPTPIPEVPQLPQPGAGYGAGTGTGGGGGGVPPKRKMETHEDSGRQRGSPRHEEERERRRVEDNNNPWKDALDTRRRTSTVTAADRPAGTRTTAPPSSSPAAAAAALSPPSAAAATNRPNQQIFAGSPRERFSPTQASPRNLELIKERDSAPIDMALEMEPSPTATTYRWSGHLRRKPVSPTLVTQDIARAPQLPTPPPQQSSPISPHDTPMAGGDAAGFFSNLDDNEAGPSRKNMGKEPAEPGDFFHQSRRRYKEMLQAEGVAPTEADKLRVFLDFVERECRFRNQLYADKANPTDVKRLTKISALLTAAAAAAAAQAENLTPVSPGRQGRGRGGDGDGDVDMCSPPRETRNDRPEAQWLGQNLTAASFPQSAMMAYEARIAEEESSRGRTSSRWWEMSRDGGGNGSCSISESVAFRSDDNDSVYGTSYPRRSRRFSKKAPRQSLREIAELANTPRNSAPGTGDAASYLHSAAFPPDRKAQSQSRSQTRAQSQSHQLQSPSQSRARTPRRRPAVKTSLDIAPLLTLLPTWPREHPAVNNSHPRLDVFRDLVRTLNDLSQLSALQAQFREKAEQAQEAHGTQSQRRRISQAERIQGLYSRGDLHYDEMERLNLDFEREESRMRQEAAEAEFKAFDGDVVTPAHRDLHERITAATAAYADLVTLVKARSPGRAGADSDADAQPELLEYLTALKWIFDVRETLHQQVFDLLAQRNDRYRSLVLAPLRDARNSRDSLDARDPQGGRLETTTQFFNQDAAARRTEFDRAKVARYEQFMDFVEEQCSLGVEEARSRFWETAPLVMECLEKIPASLENVVPIVPPEEAVEHPEWVAQPMRYLERKVAETEGAMRGVGVEEGEGLLCLLHGVKTALSRARGEGAEQERLLTEDLKEKVGMIEDEWTEGLGRILERVRAHVEHEMERLEPGSLAV